MFSTPTPKLTGINFYVPVNPSTYGGGEGLYARGSLYIPDFFAPKICCRYR